MGLEARHRGCYGNLLPSALVKLVACGALDVVDHQEWERGFGALQFQTKLLPYSFDKGWALELRGRIGGARRFRLEFEREIEAVCEARLVHYRIIQSAHSRECAGEQRHCGVAGSAFGNVVCVD